MKSSFNLLTQLFRFLWLLEMQRHQNRVLDGSIFQRARQVALAQGLEQQVNYEIPVEEFHHFDDFDVNAIDQVHVLLDADRIAVLRKIEALIEFMEFAAEEHGDFIIQYQPQTAAFNAVANRVQLASQSQDRNYLIDDPDQIRRVAPIAYSRVSLSRNRPKVEALQRILGLVHELVFHDEYITKRDLFYSFRHLFSSQRESDEALKLATAILQVPRHHLHVVSSARGLAMGDVSFSVDQQSRRSFSEQMTLIEPQQAAAMSDFWCDVDFILVVEKETVFYRLASSAFPRRARCFLMTGKGYPDLATRQFLFRLIREFPELPVLCLVDADPHGLEIYLTYKYGSRAAAAEPDCTAPSLQWIGLSVDDMIDLGLPQTLMQALSAQDVSKLASMRSRADILPFEPAIASQLDQLHQLTMKAEIEILYTLGDDGVEQYVAAHFRGIMQEIDDNLRMHE